MRIESWQTRRGEGSFESGEPAKSGAATAIDAPTHPATYHRNVAFTAKP